MPEELPPHAPELRFGPFRLLQPEQALYERDRRIPLGSRALQILTILCQRPGALISKQELLSRVWPGLHVDDAALRVHIAALRKALGPSVDGTPYIVNVPGSGYRLGAPIAPAPPNPAGPTAHNLPLSLARIVGRDAAVGSIADQLSQHRLMTIVGSGGIGKTTVAVAVGERLLPAYADGVHFVDLSLLTHDSQVAAATALVLGLPNLAEDPTAGLVAFLRDKRLLIVLDNCERVIEGSAFLVERVLTGAPGVHILATSREPLRARSERVLRLPPLDTPGISNAITAAQALVYPAVELFVERASASLGGFRLSDAQAPLVAEICTRLDGIALAIELVAGHVGAFGLQALATILNDRFRLLGPGRRTAMPRHRTLRAVLDWSFETIGEQERLLLRRLGVFNGAADLAAVQAVAEDAALSGALVLASLAKLVDKSLVIADLRWGQARYRLLDTTRAYAAEKLRLSGEQTALARRLAEYYLAAFLRARAAWTARSSTAWLAEHSRELENVRTALDWAFSPGGDVALGIELSAESLPLMFELSLAEECRRRAAIALSALESMPDPDRRLEMRVRTVLGAALTYTPGPVPQSTAVWESVLQAAMTLGDTVTEARAMWGLWNACIYGGRPRDALPYAERFRYLTVSGVEAHPRVLGERIIGITLHFIGEQQAARDHMERMLLQYRPAAHNFWSPGSQIDHGLVGQATLARILWVQGLPDQALAILQTSMTGVRAQNHAISICYVIFEAALPLMLMVGDLESASRELRQLELLAEQNGLAIWQAGAHCMHLALQATRGEPVPIAQTRDAFSALRATGYTAHLSWLSGIIAQAPGRRDEASQRMALVDEALATCEHSGERWGVAELLRIKGRLMMLEPSAAQDAGKHELLRALHLAREQGARSWELRAATSLALTSCNEEARRILQPVFEGFTEGFHTADWLLAESVMRGLEG